MLRKVKFLALVVMFFVALSVNAQVTTSVLSGVVTDGNQQAMIGATITAQPRSPVKKYNAFFNYFDEYKKKYSKEIRRSIYPQTNDEDVNQEMISDSNVVLISIIILIAFLFATVVFVVALCKDKNIRFKYDRAGIDFEIFSKRVKRE